MNANQWYREDIEEMERLALIPAYDNKRLPKHDKDPNVITKRH